MKNFPRVAISQRAYDFRLFYQKQPSISTMTGGTGAVVKALAVGEVSPDYFLGVIVDKGLLVDQPLVEEVGEVFEGGVAHHREEVVVGIIAALQYLDQVSRAAVVAGVQDSGETRPVRAAGVGSLSALVVPTVALLAAPGRAAAARVARLRRPQRMVRGGFAGSVVHLPPLII